MLTKIDLHGWMTKQKLSLLFNGKWKNIFSIGWQQKIISTSIGWQVKIISMIYHHHVVMKFDLPCWMATKYDFHCWMVTKNHPHHWMVTKNHLQSFDGNQIWSPSLDGDRKRSHYHWMVTNKVTIRWQHKVIPAIRWWPDVIHIIKWQLKIMSTIGWPPKVITITWILTESEISTLGWQSHLVSIIEWWKEIGGGKRGGEN